MARLNTLLADSHNFGQRVTRKRGRVHKPRTLLWEWLLLGCDSPLRALLRGPAAGPNQPSFDFLPSLRFYGDASAQSGEVEQLVLTPLGRGSARLRSEVAEAVGGLLALCSWLGLGDQHWENLVLGRGKHGQVVFGPVDIEMILADMARPTETKLLPDADPEYAAESRHAAGVRRALPYLGKPVRANDLLTMAGAYLRALDSLTAKSREITDLLSQQPGLAQAPIRVCLRSTAEYVHADEEPPWPPLLAAESEQLNRGDIPYFFRFYGRRGLHYYVEPTRTALGRLPLRGDVPKLEPLLDLGRGLRAPSRRRLRREGLLTVFGAFDHPSLTGSHESDELRVRLFARSLLVTLPDGEELEAQRNLRAFVGSVYSPCDCGEVRSVFVPPTTVCEPKLSSPF